MLIKMKESKGFTLVELMIVVAIIGILAAVAVPFYQRYVQKSRLTSLVFPAVHSVETNIAAFYAVSNAFPTAMTPYIKDADLSCLKTPTISGQALTFVIASSSACPQLSKVSGLTLVATASVSNGKISTWALSSSLADELGLK